MNIDATLLLVVCGLVCVGTLVLAFVLPVLDVVFEVVGAIIEFSLEIFNAGPVPGCGCVILAVILATCAGVSIWFADALSTCGTADQVNLCRLF